MNDVAAGAVAPLPVLIVGAGPTGLVLALWLTRLGVKVRIIDKTRESGTTSRAVAVAARTLELYDQLHLAHELVDHGVKVPAVNLWVRGRRAVRLPFERVGEGLTPFPYVLIFPQDAHERVLIAQLQTAGISVERETALVRFAQSAAGVRATIQREGSGEETFQARYLAGCDGAHSTVRESLATGFPGGTYGETFYVADVDATGPASNGEVHVDLDTSDFLAVFPLNGEGHARLVGSVKQAAGIDTLTFADVGEQVLRNLDLTVTKVNWFSTYRVHHRVASRFRDGHAFLLGDAAHVHSPVGGQGMNTGIGDAINLAWKLAAVLNGSAADSLLDTYEAERIGFARRLVATTDRAFTVVTSRTSFARFLRTRVVPVAAGVLFRLRVMRTLLFRTMSQIAIDYRRSALSEGSAGTLKGGDRLPWVPTEGGDNYEALTSMSWQVHVYGEVPSGVAEICSSLALPLKPFDWSPAAKHAGLRQGAVYLIRPDGYIALIDVSRDRAALGDYFRRRRLHVRRT